MTGLKTRQPAGGNQLVIYERPTEDLNSGTTETKQISKFSERMGLEVGTTGLRIQLADH